MAEKNGRPWRTVSWVALGLTAVFVLALAWKEFLFALVIFLIVGSGLTILIGAPTFLVTLCLEWSFAKAWGRTKQVAITCFSFAAHIFSAAGF